MKTITKSENYMNELWRSGSRSASDLSKSELRCLTGFLMMEIPYNSRHEFVIENDNLNELANDLTNVLIAHDYNFEPDFNDFPDNLKLRIGYLINTICKNATDYAETHIEKLFEQRRQEEANDKCFDDHLDNPEYAVRR